MSATLLTKSEYARRCGVKPGAVGNWIARGKLTRPAIRRDGRFDAEAADLQLGRTPVDMSRADASGFHSQPTGSANAHRRGGRPDAADDTAAEPIALIAPGDVPALAQHLRLDRGQVVALSKWLVGRWTA